MVSPGHGAPTRACEDGCWNSVPGSGVQGWRGWGSCPVLSPLPEIKGVTANRKEGRATFAGLEAKIHLTGASPGGVRGAQPPKIPPPRLSTGPLSFSVLLTAQHTRPEAPRVLPAGPSPMPSFPSRHDQENKREICNSFPKRSCLFLLSNSGSPLRLWFPFWRSQLPCDLTTRGPAPTPGHCLGSGAASGCALTHAPSAHSTVSGALSGARKVPSDYPHRAHWKDSTGLCVHACLCTTCKTSAPQLG